MCKERELGHQSVGDVPAVLWAAGCLPGQSLSSGGAQTFPSALEESFLVRF